MVVQPSSRGAAGSPRGAVPSFDFSNDEVDDGGARHADQQVLVQLKRNSRVFARVRKSDRKNVGLGALVDSPGSRLVNDEVLDPEIAVEAEIPSHECLASVRHSILSRVCSSN